MASRGASSTQSRLRRDRLSLFSLLFVALMWGCGEASLTNYERLRRCVERHQLNPLAGWQERIPNVERFGWMFVTSGQQVYELNVYEDNQAKTCTDAAIGVRLEQRRYDPEGSYLPFDQPELVQALGGTQLQSMSDLLMHLDQVTAWIAAHPEALQTSAEVEAPEAYINLLPMQSPPQWQN